MNKKGFEDLGSCVGIESVVLDGVFVQANGVIRNKNGYMIGRLSEDVEYHSEHVRDLKREHSYPMQVIVPKDKDETKQAKIEV